MEIFIATDTEIPHQRTNFQSCISLPVMGQESSALLVAFCSDLFSLGGV
jgi:hypothetical protein